MFAILAGFRRQPDNRAADRKSASSEITSSLAEALITPNEFTFKITLVERVDGKKKITIEDQEEALKRELATIGVGTKRPDGFRSDERLRSAAEIRRTPLLRRITQLQIRDLDKVGKLQRILLTATTCSRLDLIDSTLHRT
ncbi:MAG: hypothetical protein IPJ30_23980 [Acidobacteria bacterium]|nr:hypothetical protein [Acidobacteriota bacterium]